MLCAVTLLLKLLVPTGYMIATDHGQIAITICSGVASEPNLSIRARASYYDNDQNYLTRLQTNNQRNWRYTGTLSWRPSDCRTVCVDQQRQFMVCNDSIRRQQRLVGQPGLGRACLLPRHALSAWADLGRIDAADRRARLIGTAAHILEEMGAGAFERSQDDDAYRPSP